MSEMQTDLTQLKADANALRIALKTVVSVLNDQQRMAVTICMRSLQAEVEASINTSSQNDSTAAMRVKEVVDAATARACAFVLQQLQQCTRQSAA